MVVLGAERFFLAVADGPDAIARNPRWQTASLPHDGLRTCSVRAPSVAWRHILGHRLRQICRREEPSALNHLCLAAAP